MNIAAPISSMIESSRNTGTSMVQHGQLNLHTSESGFFECWSDAVTNCMSYWSSGIGAEDRFIDSSVLRLDLFVVGFTLHGEGQRTHFVEFQGTFSCRSPANCHPLHVFFVHAVGGYKSQPTT